MNKESICFNCESSADCEIGENEPFNYTDDKIKCDGFTPFNACETCIKNELELCDIDPHDGVIAECSGYEFHPDEIDCMKIALNKLFKNGFKPSIVVVDEKGEKIQFEQARYASQEECNELFKK